MVHGQQQPQQLSGVQRRPAPPSQPVSGMNGAGTGAGNRRSCSSESSSTSTSSSSTSSCCSEKRNPAAAAAASSAGLLGAGAAGKQASPAATQPVVSSQSMAPAGNATAMPLGPYHPRHLGGGGAASVHSGSGELLLVKVNMYWLSDKMYLANMPIRRHARRITISVKSTKEQQFIYVYG